MYMHKEGQVWPARGCGDLQSQPGLRSSLLLYHLGFTKECEFRFKYVRLWKYNTIFRTWKMMHKHTSLTFSDGGAISFHHHAGHSKRRPSGSLKAPSSSNLAPKAKFCTMEETPSGR